MPNVILEVREGMIVAAYGDMPIVVEVLDHDVGVKDGMPGYQSAPASPMPEMPRSLWEFLEARRIERSQRERRENGTH